MTSQLHSLTATPPSLFSRTHFTNSRVSLGWNSINREPSSFHYGHITHIPSTLTSNATSPTSMVSTSQPLQDTLASALVPPVQVNLGPSPLPNIYNGPASGANRGLDYTTPRFATSCSPFPPSPSWHNSNTLPQMPNHSNSIR